MTCVRTTPNDPDDPVGHAPSIPHERSAVSFFPLDLGQHMQAMCRPIGSETGGQERVFHDVLPLRQQCKISACYE